VAVGNMCAWIRCTATSRRTSSQPGLERYLPRHDKARAAQEEFRLLVADTRPQAYAYPAKGASLPLGSASAYPTPVSALRPAWGAGTEPTAASLRGSGAGDYAIDTPPAAYNTAGAGAASRPVWGAGAEFTKPSGAAAGGGDHPDPDPPQALHPLERSSLAAATGGRGHPRWRLRPSAASAAAAGAADELEAGGGGAAAALAGLRGTRAPGGASSSWGAAAAGGGMELDAPPAVRAAQRPEYHPDPPPAGVPGRMSNYTARASKTLDAGYVNAGGAAARAAGGALRGRAGRPGRPAALRPGARAPPRAGPWPEALPQHRAGPSGTYDPDPERTDAAAAEPRDALAAAVAALVGQDAARSGGQDASTTWEPDDDARELDAGRPRAHAAGADSEPEEPEESEATDELLAAAAALLRGAQPDGRSSWQSGGLDGRPGLSGPGAHAGAAAMYEEDDAGGYGVQASEPAGVSAAQAGRARGAEGRPAWAAGGQWDERERDDAHAAAGGGAARTKAGPRAPAHPRPDLDPARGPPARWWQPAAAAASARPEPAHALAAGGPRPVAAAPGNELALTDPELVDSPAIYTWGSAAAATAAGAAAARTDPDDDGEAAADPWAPADDASGEDGPMPDGPAGDAPGGAGGAAGGEPALMDLDAAGGAAGRGAAGAALAAGAEERAAANARVLGALAGATGQQAAAAAGGSADSVGAGPGRLGSSDDDSPTEQTADEGDDAHAAGPSPWLDTPGGAPLGALVAEQEAGAAAGPSGAGQPGATDASGCAPGLHASLRSAGPPWREHDAGGPCAPIHVLGSAWQPPCARLLHGCAALAAPAMHRSGRPACCMLPAYSRAVMLRLCHASRHVTSRCLHPATQAWRVCTERRAQSIGANRAHALLRRSTMQLTTVAGSVCLVGVCRRALRSCTLAAWARAGGARRRKRPAGAAHTSLQLRRRPAQTMRLRAV